MSEAFESLLAAILKDDRPAARKLLKTDRELSSRVVEESRLYETEVAHWLYGGDTALHLAAAGYRMEIAKLLLASGADPNSARNHRLSGPLHYASDGYINGPTWNEERQVKMVRCLLETGADVNAQDKNGATPLHRAVRTRCVGAVRCLFERRMQSDDQKQDWVDALSSGSSNHWKRRKRGGRGKDCATSDHHGIALSRCEHEIKRWKGQIGCSLRKQRLDTRPVGERRSDRNHSMNMASSTAEAQS